MVKQLAKLNFSKMIIYPELNGYKVEKKHDFKCDGFCISCEEKKILRSREYLTQMSHGADSLDFRKIVKKNYSYKNNTPIMFVFENPGNEYNDWSVEIPFGPFKRNIPVKHYYWIDDNITYPISSPSELLKIAKKYNLKTIYDPYFVYLQERYSLNNIYITNLTKCLLRKNNKKIEYEHIRNNCIEEIFKKELELFNPKIIFCMGVKATKWFPYNLKFTKNKNVITLYHPAAYYMKKLEIIKLNDKIIKDHLPK